jgi:CheY-like chemotaxis protein
VLLTVGDNGSGMPPEVIAQLFEPFFTTKKRGEGTGLGLATVYGIVKQNEGFITVESHPGLGSTFRVYLPRYSGRAKPATGAGGTKAGGRGHETVLLVEDEISILNMTRKMLEHQGYRILSAASPGEAIRKAREHHGSIDLLLTDVIMPEMNGRDLAKNLLSLYPKLNRLFMSGYTADIIAHHGVLDAGVHFIQKPFTIKALTSKIREILDDTLPGSKGSDEEPE